MLNPRLSRILIPLLEDISIEDKMKVARKYLELRGETSSDAQGITLEARMVSSRQHSISSAPQRPG